MAERKRAAKNSKEREYMKIDNFSILRTHEFESGDISFDADINGVKLYRLSVVKPKDSGKSEFIGFPSYQNNGKYYNYYYLPLSDEDVDKIIQAVYDNLDD